ncbi:hypothetical protein [Azospirillum rugosum]|uniref:Uncharacterized protein n=1 Tax=Azospirillum rugosum TaxID=416170 RepID=A0ABS4SP81_9PROT|nr:hypothetical protein [Azospirillum rugosum]MBP2294366.1 hypothetical protein [Azospirillum rugosum]MDQ0527701.1 hypothetical protein [Azospirillum rugosum]
MAQILVFAIDWTPEAGDVGTGGGLRSRQVADMLRDAGHRVAVAVPAASKTVALLRRQDPARLDGVLLYDGANQLEIIRRVRPDVIVWQWPTMRAVPMSGLGDVVQICDLNGLQDHEIAHGIPGLLPLAEGKVLAAAVGADLVLTGSEEQNGYWIAKFGTKLDGVPTAVVPYSAPRPLLPPRGQEGKAGEGGLQKRLCLAGTVYPWNSSLSHLDGIVAWAERRGDVRIDVVATIDPASRDHLAIRGQLERLRRSPCVSLSFGQSVGELFQWLGAGGFALDLYPPTIERRLAVPIRTVNALACGLPILCNLPTQLNRRLVEAGCARMVALEDGELGGDLEAGPGPALVEALDAAMDLDPVRYAGMRAAARAQAEEGPFRWEAAAERLAEGVDQALRRLRRKVAWRPGRKHGTAPALGHALVLSDEPENLQELRLHAPFGELYRQGEIGGYTVVSRNRVVMSTLNDPEATPVDAIWLQRRPSSATVLALHAIDRPYLLDLDDHLLVSPTYRAAFPPEHMQMGRMLVRQCAVLSCSTARLAAQLGRYAAADVVSKAIVTPNLAQGAAAPRPSGPPTAVVWVSSDMPALSVSTIPVLRALRDFCLAFDLDLVCVGHTPPTLLTESDVRIRKLPLQRYADYLRLLSSQAPAILFCPLETHADPATQDFIDGKSDIKMLECLATGLVGVFSAAAPFADSTLRAGPVCDNTYESWYDGLCEARETLLAGGGDPAIPDDRQIGRRGLAPWLEALRAARLDAPFPLRMLKDAYVFVYNHLTRRMLTKDEFDEAAYLESNKDVDRAVRNGTFQSAYEHYKLYGFFESQIGHRAHGVGGEESDSMQLFANLLGTLSDLRTTTDNRAPQIEHLKAARAARAVAFRRRGER